MVDFKKLMEMELTEYELCTILDDYQNIILDGNLIDLGEFFDGYSLICKEEFMELKKGDTVYDSFGNELICQGGYSVNKKGNLIVQCTDEEIYVLGEIYKEPFKHYLYEELGC